MPQRGPSRAGLCGRGCSQFSSAARTALQSKELTRKNRLPSGKGELVSGTRAAASIIGVVAGLVGIYHGYNETLQGSTAPSGIMINAIGPPCQGSGCFPA